MQTVLKILLLDSDRCAFGLNVGFFAHVGLVCVWVWCECGFGAVWVWCVSVGFGVGLVCVWVWCETVSVGLVHVWLWCECGFDVSVGLV